MTIVIGFDKSVKGKLREDLIAICERFDTIHEQVPTQRKVDLLFCWRVPN